MNLPATCQQMFSGVPEFMTKKRSRGHPRRGSYLKYTALAKNKRSQKVRLNVFDRLETAIRLKLIGQKDTLEI